MARQHYRRAAFPQWERHRLGPGGVVTGQRFDPIRPVSGIVSAFLPVHMHDFGFRGGAKSGSAKSAVSDSAYSGIWPGIV